MASTSRSLFIFFFLIVSVTADHEFGRLIDRKDVGLKKEKLSHFRFYWHNILSGHNLTSVQIISPPVYSTTLFGGVNMIDNTLTLGSDLSSKLIGRSQGFYASACQSEVGLLMSMNFEFIDGKYNGSTITILGRNPVFQKVREMSLIGGSGLFRFARGYIEAKTHWFSYQTGDATAEYNFYVMHY